ncbi:phospholipid phosphatase [Prolixibacter sp. SD074]|nr:phospholipid phosphatase [Prolixibacter sp. SD074]
MNYMKMANRFLLFVFLTMMMGNARAATEFHMQKGEGSKIITENVGVSGNTNSLLTTQTDVYGYWQQKMQKDSLQQEPGNKTCPVFVRKAILPTGLIAAGLITMAVPSHTALSKYTIHDTMHGWNPNFHTTADNYLQYAPAVITLGLSAAGLKGRNDLLNQSLILAKSELLMTLVVQGIKRTSKVERPYGGVFTSFPSGHTAQAFLSATFLAKEYGHISPWISVGGYVTAAGVGVLRMMNNKHWISDVLAGAGIGILSVEFVYLTHQHRWGKKSNLVFAPTMYHKGGGVALAYTF